MNATGLHVLLVEDNSDSAETMAVLLRAEGYSVQIAADGLQAIEAAGAKQPDVVLLDIGLPGMDGYQVAKQLRKQTEPKRALIIAITGYGTAEDQQRSERAGIDLHVTKPAEPGPLLVLLKRFQATLGIDYAI